MTSTPPRSPVPSSATGPVERLAGPDSFLALVDQARAEVQAALAVDAAERARRTDSSQTVLSENADDIASAEDAAVPPTQLEQVISALLGARDVAWAPVRIVG